MKAGFNLRLLTLVCLLVLPCQRLFANSSTTNDSLDFTQLIPNTLPRTATFRQPGWCLWDPCIVNGGDGKFYLFYSRW